MSFNSICTGDGFIRKETYLYEMRRLYTKGDPHLCLCIGVKEEESDTLLILSAQDLPKRRIYTKSDEFTRKETYLHEKRRIYTKRAMHRCTLQHTATYCSTLQHTAKHQNTLQHHLHAKQRGSMYVR